jgi:hypothetical protein
MCHAPLLQKTLKDVFILMGPQEIVPDHIPVDQTKEPSAIRKVLDDVLSGDNLHATH